MRAVEQTSPREQSRGLKRQSAESKRDANYESESNRRVLFAHSQKGDVKRQHATARSEDKHDGKLGSALSGAELRHAMRVATRCHFHGGLNCTRRVNRLLANANENEIPLGVHQNPRKEVRREIVPRATHMYLYVSVPASGSQRQ